MPKGEHTLEEIEAKIMRNVAKRDPRTGAEIASRVNMSVQAINRSLGALVERGLLIKGKIPKSTGRFERADNGRPPVYVKA